MRQLLFIAVAACAASAPSAQAFDLPEVTYPRIAERAATPEAFVPPGWRLEHLARGRLDSDAREDALLVLRMDAAANVVDNDGMGPPRFDTNPRMLLALVAEADGRWRRVMVDHRLVPRPESPVMSDYLGDDAGAAVVIRANRTWAVSLDSFASAGSWTMSHRTFTFRLEGDCMRLVGFDQNSVHRASGATLTESVNYLTGRAWTQAGTISDAPGPQQPMRLQSKAPVCITDIGNGFGFEPALTATR